LSIILIFYQPFSFLSNFLNIYQPYAKFCYFAVLTAVYSFMNAWRQLSGRRSPWSYTLWKFHEGAQSGDLCEAASGGQSNKDICHTS